MRTMTMAIIDIVPIRPQKSTIKAENTQQPQRIEFQLVSIAGRHDLHWREYQREDSEECN